MADRLSIMDTYPICLMGVGPAGRHYLKDLLRDWRLDVVGFTNRSEDRRHAVAAETGVPGFADLDALLAGVARRPQAVVIATANTTHKDFAIQALEAGLHVFCEKPMAMNLVDCQAMLEAERRSGKVLQIGFEYRYGTMTGRLRELIDCDQFGILRCIDVVDSRGHWWPDNPATPVEQVWRLNPAIGGGPIVHCGIHELDLMRYYAGEVAELQAFVPPRSIGFYPEHAPDHVNLQVRFASGCCGSFTLYHNIAPTWYRPLAPYVPDYHRVPGHHLDITVTGTKGSAVAEIYAEQLHINAFDYDEHETRYLRSETFGHQNPNASHHNTVRMIIEFCLRMRDGLGPLHSAEDSARTTALGFAAENAVQQALASGWASERIVL